MRSFNPPVVKPREPVVLDYTAPTPSATPADLLGVAGLVCGLMFFVAVGVAIGGSFSVRQLATLALFLLPPLAVGFGLASKWRPAATRRPARGVASAAVWLGTVQLLGV